MTGFRHLFQVFQRVFLFVSVKLPEGRQEADCREAHLPYLQNCQKVKKNQVLTRTQKRLIIKHHNETGTPL